jgi:hypothetical protein
MVEPGNEKAPACARRSASVALFGHTSDVYMPERDDRSSHRQVGWSTAVSCQRLFPHPVNPATEDHRRARLSPPPLSAQAVGWQGWVALVRAGSVGRRKPLVLGGHERSRRAHKNRRSRGIHRYDLGRRNRTALGSNPTSSAFS